MSDILFLSDLKKGQQAKIVEINEPHSAAQALPVGEWERRLLEMGFCEGTEVSIAHESPFGRDAIVVSLYTDHLVALRRAEAAAIRVILVS